MSIGGARREKCQKSRSDPKHAVLSNGSFLLEPRVLVAPDKIPARTRKMLESSVASLKRGKASAPIDLSLFIGS